MEQMPSKKIIMEEECLDGILRGVEKTAAPIRSTMGARGQLVLIQTTGGGAYSTKDGANTARQIKLPDQVEDMGASLAIEAAINTADQAGDGTTSTVVVLHELLKGGVAAVKDGANKIVVANELEAIGKRLIDAIPDMATEVDIEDIDTLTNIATISANGDEEIGKIVAGMVNQIGKDGPISVLDSGTFETRTEIVTGTKVDSGYFSPYFINNPGKRICELDNPMIAITDYDMNKVSEIISVVTIAGKAGRPLVIIGSNFEGEALAGLIHNNGQGIQICAIRAPGTGEIQVEYLEDIASVTGGVFISGGKGKSLEQISEEDLGGCKKITISFDKTIITDGEGDTEKRILELREQLENATIPPLQDSLKERIGRLDGGVGVIYVGDSAGSSLKEKMDRIEDAVFATQAAVEEGVVAGGGAAYGELSRVMGNVITTKALWAPMRQICHNAGLDGDEHVDINCETLGACTDVTTGVHVDAVTAGIIDPAKVVRCVLQNAFKNAVTILKTNAAITIEK